MSTTSEFTYFISSSLIHNIKIFFINIGGTHEQMSGSAADGLQPGVSLKDKYPNFEVGLKCILMVNPYLLVCPYIK